MERVLYIVSARPKDSFCIEDLHDLLSQHKGSSDIFFHFDSEGKKKIVQAHSKYKTNLENGLLKKLTILLGDNSVFYSKGNQLQLYKNNEN